MSDTKDGGDLRVGAAGQGDSAACVSDLLGHEVGLDGYTTVQQAQALHDHLALSSNARLLDVGAGHGWPGSHLAASSGCSLVATDIPVDVLRAAQRYIGQATAVSADGRELPFPSGSFDVVVHADVFC